MAQLNRRTRPPKQGRWRAYALSIMLHSALVVAAVYGWFTWKHRPPPVTTMAIEATVVEEKALKDVAPPPKPESPPPEPEPPPVEEQGPPKPDPAELERKKEEERLAQEKKVQEEKERLEAEKKAAAEKAAAEKKALDKKKADDAAAAKKAADEKARLAREAELKRMLEAEERGNALRGSSEANRWLDQIKAKISSNWKRPPSAQPGVTCIVMVTQVPGGDVTGVRVDSCSINDAALRQSVEDAVYRSSPLPPPPNPALFDRNLKLEFAPQE